MPPEREPVGSSHPVLPASGGVDGVALGVGLGSSEGARRTRVLIVDADRRVRRDLAELVSLAPGLQVVGAAASAESAVGLATREDPDVVVIDPRLPDVDLGLAVIARLRLDRPDVRVVVMSCFSAVEDPALANGADAFVSKSGQPLVLLDAIIGPADGGTQDVA